MNIYIDGDGCPVIRQTVEVAKAYNLPVTIVKNYHHQLHYPTATIISVGAEKDSADFYIANHVSQGDLVITQDYGLAALILACGAHIMTQNGLRISNFNIDDLLARRYSNQVKRQQRQSYGSKIKKRTPADDSRFKDHLNRFLTELNQSV